MGIKTWLIALLATVMSFDPVTGPARINEIFPGESVGGAESQVQTVVLSEEHKAFLSACYEEYDSYVVGGPSAASYRTQTLNTYLNADFCNLAYTDADAGYDRALVAQLLEQDEVKHIVLVLNLEDAAAQPSRSVPWKRDGGILCSCWEAGLTIHSDPDQLSACGCYEKLFLDVQSVGDLKSYRAANAAVFGVERPMQALTQMDYCVQNVAAIRWMCQEAGTQLTVIVTPAEETQLKQYEDQQMDLFYDRLAQVTDYWNASISSLSYDPRYFYTPELIRSDGADLVLSCVFEEPTDVAVHCTRGNVPLAGELKEQGQAAGQGAVRKTVPMLLYHHLAEEGEQSDTMVYPQTFEHHMALLKENGYTPVSFEALIDHVERGEELPEHPVVVTFDDGYQSNFEYALPILSRYGFPATVFAVGSSIGHDTYYKQTQYPITPHFGAEEISAMTASKVMEIHSHTYDMHQWPPFESGPMVRENILPLAGESVSDYISALTQDVAEQDRVFAASGLEKSCVLAFPGGRHTTLTNAVLRTYGYRVTVTTDPSRVNVLVPGLSQSLIDLGRMNISGATTDQEILTYLARVGN